MTEEAQDNTDPPPVEWEAGSSPSPAGRQVTVLQVTPTLGAGGGIERGTVEIARAIVEAGGRSLVASAGGVLVHDLARARAEHFPMPVDSKNPLVIRANIGRLERLIREQGVDILHVRSRAPAWSAYYAAQRTGARFVTTFHGAYPGGNPLKRRYNAIMTRGERVIAISSYIAGHILQVYGVPPARIRVIHRGVDLERFDPARVSAERVAQLAGQWRLDDGLPVIMLPGRLSRWKGQTVFLDAIVRLGRKDIRCVMVGSDQGRSEYRRELEDLIVRYDLGAEVRLVDHCDDMPAAYMLTDVVVSASTNPEAFGRIVPEAQAMGRPVVVSNHGGVRETIIEGATGWLTPPGDAEALAAALERVLAMGSEARRALAERAIHHVRENFSKDAMCDKTLDVYNEVLSLKAAE